MKYIAVLMTCHNRKAKTLHCLDLLFNQKGLGDVFTLKVYLVDDGSKDGTGAEVKERYPEIEVIEGNGNLYWNRGMYMAWEAAAKQHASIDYYLWLNDDTDIYNDAILKVLAASDVTGKQAIICGCIESAINKGELTYGGGVLRHGKRIMNYPNQEVMPCDIIHGNCVLVPSHVYNAIGNLDWKFTHAIGDHDYGLRAKKAGILCYTTGDFIGTCEKNDGSPKWRMPQIKFKDRVKNLYSPLSYSPPNEFFVYERRHFGLLVALKHMFTIHLRLIVPGLLK
jgi:GT2 family glycosyltransferase